MLSGPRSDVTVFLVHTQPTGSSETHGTKDKHTSALEACWQWGWETLLAACSARPTCVGGDYPRCNHCYCVFSALSVITESVCVCVYEQCVGAACVLCIY